MGRLSKKKARKASYCRYWAWRGSRKICSQRRSSMTGPPKCHTFFRANRCEKGSQESPGEAREEAIPACLAEIFRGCGTPGCRNLLDRACSMKTVWRWLGEEKE